MPCKETTMKKNQDENIFGSPSSHKARFIMTFTGTCQTQKQRDLINVTSMMMSPGCVRWQIYYGIGDSTSFALISEWENENQMTKWRNHEGHRFFQEVMRKGRLTDFRVTVGCVMRSYDQRDRSETPSDSNDYFSKPHDIGVWEGNQECDGPTPTHGWLPKLEEDSSKAPEA